MGDIGRLAIVCLLVGCGSVKAVNEGDAQLGGDAEQEAGTGVGGHGGEGSAGTIGGGAGGLAGFGSGGQGGNGNADAGGQGGNVGVGGTGSIGRTCVPSASGDRFDFHPCADRPGCGMCPEVDQRGNPVGFYPSTCSIALEGGTYGCGGNDCLSCP